MRRFPSGSSLYLVFFLAGAPALIYQVVWQRALTLYFGVEIYSTSITVATFMAGLGLGALVGGHLADSVRKPALWYAGCEAGLGFFGAGSLYIFDQVGTRLADASLAVVLFTDFALMLLPTFLMGMTLPLMCRSIPTGDQQLGRHFSTLYSLNTLGAALGALVTAYLLIGWWGLDGTTRVAAALNVCLALIVPLLVPDPADPEASDVAAPIYSARLPAAARPSRIAILACSLLSGFLALGYELVAYRILTCLLHGTAYVFGTILFCLLLGIGAGSWRARHSERAAPMVAFGRAQLAIGAWIVVAATLLGRASWLPGLKQLIGATALTTFHPAPELAAGQLSARALYSLFDIGFWSVFFVAIPAFFMGFGFPQLVSASTATRESLGRSVGAVYLANIVGSVAGSLVFGLYVLDAFGTENALRLLVPLSGLTALLALVARKPPSPAVRLWPVFLVLVATTILPPRGALLRAIHYADFEEVEFTAHEDRSGVVALRRQSEIISFAQESKILGRLRLLIDGAEHGGFDRGEPEVELDPGVGLALSAHPSPRRVLSIGLGDGKMCATAVNWPGVEELVVVELSQGLFPLLQQTSQGRLLAQSEKLQLVEGDGRRWLQAHPEQRFDVVLAWPLHAAHANSGNLFSLEFLDLVSQRLRPGGLVYLRTADAYSTARTIALSFPHVVRYGSASYIAGLGPFRFAPGKLQQEAATLEAQLEADGDFILQQTTDALSNRDLRPNAEFYLTYRWVDALQTWGGHSIYRKAPGAWSRSWIRPHLAPTQAR